MCSLIALPVPRPTVDSTALPESGIAIVGSGRMARRHAEAYRALACPPRVAYIVSPLHAADLAAWSGAIALTTLGQALDDAAVSMVDICTPPATHRELVVAALEAGVHVMVEKPIALDLADAAAIAEAERGSLNFVMVAHVVRFVPAYRAVEASVEQGDVGRVHTVRARRVSAHPRNVAWIDDEDASGGPIVDLMVHDFDQANRYLGRARTAFAKRSSTKSPVEVIVGYDGGGVAVIEGSWWMPDSHPFSSSIEVHGDLGVVTATVGPDVGTVLYPAVGEPRSLVLSGLEGYEAQAAYMLGCVSSKVAPQIGTTLQSFDALAVALAARLSLATGRVEEVGAFAH